MSLQRRHVLAGFAALTLLAFLWADLSGPAPDPWLTLRQIGWGILHPTLPALPALAHAAALTVAFALCGVALGAGAGLLLAPLYQFAPVRWLCVSVRAVHELFWARCPKGRQTLVLCTSSGTECIVIDAASGTEEVVES
ncbi:MAG: hypothetical protein VX974_05095, partial [Pseudomonadota bacterium]|nr:hypothetical protein [Pseudomonadota bacterium]